MQIFNTAGKSIKIISSKASESHKIFTEFSERTGQGREYQSNNRKTKIFEMQYEGRNYILKRYLIPANIALLKKIELAWRYRFRSPCIRAYHKSFELAEAGVGTIRPLAAWIERGDSFIDISTVLIYEKIEDTISADEYYRAGRNISELAVHMGKIVSRMHARGLIHADLDLKNWLVSPSGMVLYLIDAESTYSCFRFFGRFYLVRFIFSLRRLKADPEFERQFLQAYLPPCSNPVFWHKFWRIFQSPWIRPLKNLKKVVRELR